VVQAEAGTSSKVNVTIGCELRILKLFIATFPARKRDALEKIRAGAHAWPRSGGELKLAPRRLAKPESRSL
jgi:hypothetical protein